MRENEKLYNWDFTSWVWVEHTLLTTKHTIEQTLFLFQFSLCAIVSCTRLALVVFCQIIKVD